MFPAQSTRSEAKAIFPAESNPRRLRSDQALLLVSASEGDANMLYAAGFFGSDEPVGTRIAWALQVALPPLVAGALLIGAARREGGGPAESTPSPPHLRIASCSLRQSIRQTLLVAARVSRASGL